MLQGTMRLVRLALRRDRISLSLTLALVVALVASSAPALQSTYSTFEAQLSYVTTSVSSAVGRIFQGVINGVGLGTILTAETFITTAIILAVMSIFIVSRHTRHNEEIGAAELIGSMDVGRNSPLTSALIVAVGANVLAGGVIFGLLSLQDGLSIVGSLYLSLSLAMCGIFFAGLSAVTVQLSDYRRGSNMMAIGALIVAFIVRAVGDILGTVNPDGLGITSHWISWLSPLGWANQTLPYSENKVLPLLLLGLGFAVCVSTAYVLLNKRDLGSGILNTRPGSARAGSKLLSRFGLTMKIQKTAMISWVGGAALLGGMMGAVITDFKDAFSENEQLREFVLQEGGLENLDKSLMSAMLPMFGAMLAGYVVLALSKTQDEEASGRLESLASTGLSKTKWFSTHLIVITFGVGALLLALGISGALGYSLAADVRALSFGDIVLAGLVSLPAMLLFTSIISLVFASVARFVKSFAWTFFAYCTLITSFAGIFKWPQWTANLSPFTHTPPYPNNNFEALPLVVMIALSVAIFYLALKLFKRRDLSLK